MTDEVVVDTELGNQPDPQTPAGDPAADLLTSPAAGEPAAPAPAAAEPADKVETKTFAATGDAGLDLALEYLAGLGFSEDDAEILEAAKGNFSYLEAKLGAMGDKAKGSERYLAIAKAAAERMRNEETAQYEARRKAVLDAVGGEENWVAIQDFANANATPEELEEVRAALQQGGMIATAMAKMLAEQAAIANADAERPAPKVAKTQAAAAQGGGKLTLDGYRTELTALVKKVGAHNIDRSEEYAALRRKYSNVTN